MRGGPIAIFSAAAPAAEEGVQGFGNGSRSRSRSRSIRVNKRYESGF